MTTEENKVVMQPQGTVNVIDYVSSEAFSYTSPLYKRSSLAIHGIARHYFSRASGA